MFKKPRNKSEHYIWSLISLGIALSIVALNFLPAEAFGFISTVIALLSMGMSMSDRWKNADKWFHLSVLVGSSVIVVGIIILHGINVRRDSNELYGG